jgi:nanoRNase/pAp phosphatase (c-di-AMP/oligoRNAs hydrolase)
LYRISSKITIDSDLKAEVYVEPHFADGYIQVDLNGIMDSEGNEYITTGSFVLSRSCEDDNYTAWEKLSTFKLIAELIDKSQIDFTKLYSNLYERPYSEIKFHGYLSDNLNITENGFAYLVITPEILKEYNVDSATPSNMINDFSNIRGVYVWMFATYDERNEIYKVNIRSKGPVINDTAAMYGGGGHKYASGARIRDKEEINKLIKSLGEECIQYKESLLSD